QEIRETIEQSEKYKRELSNSGRQEEPKMTINTSEKPVFRLIEPEQKPNLKTSPAADFKKQKISPNTAEGKERLGLKDLAKLVEESGQGKVEFVSKGKDKKRGKRRSFKGKNKAEKAKNTPNPTPVVPSVKPEIEYREKSVVEINPNHNSLPLSTPVKRAEDFAAKDNSVDGFLAIKHDK
ncbi:hypothetical protein IJG26_01485, partial [Candidatus Saccharibacteria bacterium]|nr:hypothetical protein [Candidatus Saccharibacteria bacterium]